MFLKLFPAALRFFLLAVQLSKWVPLLLGPHIFHLKDFARKLSVFSLLWQNVYPEGM